MALSPITPSLPLSAPISSSMAKSELPLITLEMTKCGPGTASRSPQPLRSSQLPLHRKIKPTLQPSPRRANALVRLKRNVRRKNMRNRLQKNLRKVKPPRLPQQRLIRHQGTPTRQQIQRKQMSKQSQSSRRETIRSDFTSRNFLIRSKMTPY